MSSPVSLTIATSAKVNLSLHITGKRADGYHLLDSLVAFTDIADKITVEESEEFSFSLTGPCAGILQNEPDNLCITAAQKLAQEAGRELNVSITLEKNIPMGAGLGGGSADAAATLKALADIWNLSLPKSDLERIAASLGADVPACLRSHSVHMTGIGEQLKDITLPKNIPAILIHPGTLCPTKEVYQNFSGRFSSPDNLPDKGFQETETLIDYLSAQTNDLTQAAIAVVPDIITVLDRLNEQPQIKLARMSGSGSACFGIFKNENAALKAAQSISVSCPDWWIKTCRINP